MARSKRIIANSGIYHIILRGNNKQNIFLEENDKTFFLNRLMKYLKSLGMEIYAYCLMPNHVHILLKNTSTTPGLLIQKLAASYVKYFNTKYERTGSLFQARYKSEAVEDSLYFKTVLRYILQNSEKANLGKMENYKWNSYANLTTTYESNKISTDFIYGIFGGRKSAIEFLSLRKPDQCMDYESKPVIPDRKAITLITDVCKISSPFLLAQMELNLQKKYIQILRDLGMSISQLSRLTGISKGFIRKINKSTKNAV